jgi:hypothetical protein
MLVDPAVPVHIRTTEPEKLARPVRLVLRKLREVQKVLRSQHVAAAREKAPNDFPSLNRVRGIQPCV